MSEKERTEIYFGDAAASILNEHTRALKMHTDALLCNCECMGMNAMNCIAAVLNTMPPYSDADFAKLINKYSFQIKSIKEVIKP